MRAKGSASFTALPGEKEGFHGHHQQPTSRAAVVVQVLITGVIRAQGGGGGGGRGVGDSGTTEAAR